MSSERQRLNTSAVRSTFLAGGRGYDADHVLQAAEFRGELQPLRQSWIPAWAATTQPQEAEPDPEELDQAAADFRYARNLVTAEECEQWLDALALTSDEFAEHFVRFSLAGPDGWFANPTPRTGSPPISSVMDEEMTRAFRVDLLLSDLFPDMARALAWRVALQEEGRPAPGPDAVAAQRRRGLENQRLTGLNLEDWLAQWNGTPGWFEELLVLEALFQAESEGFLIPRNQERALAGMRLPLLRLELEVLELESEAAAREAFLCTTEDSVSLAELAAQNGHSLRRMSRFLEEFPQDWQQALVSAAPDQTLPVFAAGDEFQLCRVLTKREPGLSDPDVLGRINTGLLRAHFQELENRHIKWLINLELEE